MDKEVNSDKILTLAYRYAQAYSEFQIADIDGYVHPSPRIQALGKKACELWEELEKEVRKT